MRFLFLVLLVGCSGERFETSDTSLETDTSASPEETTQELQEDPDVNVNVNVEVNVDGTPVASASATATAPDSSAPRGDAGDSLDGLVQWPIPTIYVNELTEDDTREVPVAGDGGAVTEPSVPREPVPAVVLSDDVASFRDWFIIGPDTVTHDLARVSLGGGGYAAQSSVVGSRDYTLTGVLFGGPHGDPYSALDYDGVSFWVCGNIGAFRFEVPTEATIGGGQQHGTLVDVTPQWRLVTVEWNDLGLDNPTHTFDLESVRGLYFTVVDEDYELWLSHVQFWTDGAELVGTPPSGACVTSE
ncbi:MAG: hypothetical protein ACTS8S_04885 [Giesbergeria sp.]